MPTNIPEPVMERARKRLKDRDHCVCDECISELAQALQAERDLALEEALEMKPSEIAAEIRRAKSLTPEQST